MLRKRSDMRSFMQVTQEIPPTIRFKHGSARRIIIEGTTVLSQGIMNLLVQDLEGVKYLGNDCYEGPAVPRWLEFLTAVHRGAVQISGDVQTWYTGIVEEERHLIDAKSVDPEVLPTLDGLEAWQHLHQFQKQAVYFALVARHTILGDEPGLGKTLVALVASQADPSRSRRVLVVCPNSLKAWWAQEAQGWLGLSVDVAEPSIYAAQLQSYLKNPDSGLFVINYELLLRLPQLRTVKWDWVIADEAHRIKNPSALTTEAFRRIKGAYSMLITATPLANQPAELWSLLHYSRPKQTPAYGFFKSFYQDEVITLSGRPKPAGPRRGHENMLKREHEPVMIRRLKSEVGLQLPPKTYQRMPLWLLPEQVKAYRQMAHDSLVELPDGSLVLGQEPAVAMLRLRQIASNLATLDPTNDCSAKLDACTDLLQDRPDEPIVFFTVFRATAQALHARCQRAKPKVESVLFIGDQTPEADHEAIKQFTSGGARAFIATIQKGGVGLNLQRASTLVFIDKHWNPAMQAQAEDRIHRIGQERPCLILNLHHKHTIDDYVERMLTKKIGWNSRVIKLELPQYLEDSLRFL